MLRTCDTEVHPARVNALEHFFGGSSVALRDADLLESVRPSGTRECKGFYLALQDFAQLGCYFIGADHRTQPDNTMPRPGRSGQKRCHFCTDIL